MIQLQQIAAMARYEFIMHWRRRIIWVVVLSMAGICVSAMLITGTQIQRMIRETGAFAGELDIVPFFGLVIYFLLIALFTPIAAEAVPLDRQIGVYELMDTLPLRRESYLIGKLAGLFLSQLVALAAVMIIIAVVARSILGPFDVLTYVRMWLFAALPLALLNPTLCLLVGAGQPTRRRAAFVGVAVAIFCFLSFTSSVNNGIAGAGLTLWDILNPARPAMLRYLMPSMTAIQADVQAAVPLTFLAGILELLVAGGLFIMWTRWCEQHI